MKVTITSAPAPWAGQNDKSFVDRKGLFSTTLCAIFSLTLRYRYPTSSTSVKFDIAGRIHLFFAMIAEFFEFGSPFRVVADFISRKFVQRAYSERLSASLSEKLNFVVSWIVGDVKFIKDIPKDNDEVVVIPREATAIKVYYEVDLLISDGKRKVRRIYRSHLTWEDILPQFLVVFETTSANHTISDNSTHVAPIISAGYIPELLVVEIRTSYCSLTLDTVLPRVHTPRRPDKLGGLDISGFKDNSISTGFLDTAVSAYLDSRSDSLWIEWVNSAHTMLTALHTHYELNPEPKEAPRRTIVDILVLATLSILPEGSRRRLKSLSIKAPKHL